MVYVSDIKQDQMELAPPEKGDDGLTDKVALPEATEEAVTQGL